MASLPRNPEIAEQFELLADLLELEGAESFRVIAYRRAATRMRETSSSVAQLALDGKAKELQGIGKTIEEKIVQIVEQGEIEALAKRKASIPSDVVLFMRLPGLGPKTAARIWKELGISTLAELQAAAEGQGGVVGAGARMVADRMAALRDAVVVARPAPDGVDATLSLRFRRGRGAPPAGGAEGRPPR